MQIVYKDENKGGSSGKADLVGIIIYIRRGSRHLEGEYLRRARGRRIRI